MFFEKRRKPSEDAAGPSGGDSENTPSPPDPLDEQVTPTYFLSLEFVEEEQTYWLVTTIDGSRCREFARFPIAAFGGRALNAGRLRWEGGNSELLVFSADGSGARLSLAGEENTVEVDVGAMESLSWNEMCKKALRDFDPELWTGLYLNNWVRLCAASQYGNTEVAYSVTAFLPEEGTVAICGEDHNPPEIINWRAISGLDTLESLRGFLADLTVEAIALGDRFLRVE